MKRILVITFCLLMASTAFAQGPDFNPKGPEKGNKPDKSHWANKIISEKIAFFTNELDLSPEEAEVFWPVYNQYSKECRSAHDATMESFRNVCKAKEANLSDKEIEAATDNYIKSLKKENEVLEKYYPKFKKVLPIGKVVKLFKAEEDFRMKMIRGLKNNPR